MSESLSTKAIASRLLSEGKGEAAISTALGITRHRARALVLELTKAPAGAAVAEIEPRTAPEFAERITACWHRSREAYIEAGRLLCSAKANLAHGEFQSMVETLPFQIRKAEMLMEMFRDSRLVNPQYVALLPSEIGTLYDLTRLPEAKFQAAITDGTIRPDIERKEVQSLLRGGPINGARSVMGSRQEPDDSLDFFPTPPWATRALCEVVLPHIEIDLTRARIWEPACGEGHIADVLLEYSQDVCAADIHDYGIQADVQDFLAGEGIIKDWIITNPPFGDNAIKFVQRALELTDYGVAMFFRSQWAVEGIERYESIFRDNPPTLCAFFVERVNLCKGRWDPDGSTATAYCWLVWVKDRAPLPPFWIPPGQREALTKPDDRARFAAWSLPNDDRTRHQSGDRLPETSTDEAAE